MIEQDLPKTKLEQEKEIIEEAYAATMEPERLAAFEAYWEAYIDAGLAGNEGSADGLLHTPIDAHIDRAMDIVERLSTIQNLEKGAQAIVDSHFGFGFLINRAGKIIASNSDAVARTQYVDRLADLGLDPESHRKITGWIEQDAKSNAVRFLFIHVQFDDSESKTCLFATAVDMATAKHNVTETHFLITSVDYEISSDALAAIRETYGLTDAEADVAMRLVNGQAALEIASDRAASIHTVRTQIKKILSKTDARNIPDMVHTLSSMAGKFTAVGSQLTRVANTASNRTLSRPGRLTLPDGRNLAYIEQGHPKGRPVLHIHSAVAGAHLTPASAKYAVLHGIRIISPYRPGYGDSDQNVKPNIQATCDAFADDLKSFIDHLGLKKVVVVGKPYGQRFAAKYPELVQALCCLDYVPLWSEDQLEYMSTRYRIMVKTSMHSPHIVKYPIRLAKTLVDGNRGRMFLDGLSRGRVKGGGGRKHKSSESADHIIFNLQELLKQGVDAFTHDVASIHTDWSEDAKKLTVPVIVISRDPNPYQPRYMFEHYQDLVPHAKIVWLDKTKNHTGFKAVIDEINMLDL